MDHSVVETNAVEITNKPVLGPNMKQEAKPKWSPAPDAPENAETPETPEAKEPEVKSEPDPFSPKFAALTRKERELREKEKALEQEAQRLKSEGESTAKIKEAIARAKEDPDKLFEVANMTYQDVVEHYLKGGNAKEAKKIETLEEKLNALEKQREQEAEERQKEAQQAKVQDFYKTIESTLEQAGEKYELTRLLLSPEDIYNEMVEHYLRTEKEFGVGRPITIEDLAEQKERELEEELKSKVQTSPKIKKMLGLIVDEPKEDDQTQPTPERQAVQSAPTLSNKQFSEQPVKTEKRLSRDESIKMLAEKLRRERYGVN